MKDTKLKHDDEASAAIVKGSLHWTPTYGLLLGVIALGLVFSFTSDYFLTGNNLLNISRAISINGIVAMGVTVLVIAGALDLSVASVMSLSGVVMAEVLGYGANLGVAVIAALAFGALAGIVNGLLVTKFGLNSLIVTLGTLFVWQGVAAIIAGGSETPVTNTAFRFLGSGRVLGLPMPFILLLAIFAVVYVMLQKTRIGIHIYASGGDALSSRRMGLKVDRILLIAFILSGIGASIGGILLSSSIGLVTPFAAQGQELPIISAVILGGAALHGGRGSPAGTFGALVLVGVMFNGLNLLGVPPAWQNLAQGVVLIGAITADAYRQRRESR